MTFIPLFWVGYGGMPRRIHDYPAIFMGWQGMASVGHLTTLIGVIFFFIMLLDSHIERRVVVYSTLGIPRWHKRVNYYMFKIRYLMLSKKQLAGLPNSRLRLLFTNPYFNEYEKYEFKV